MNEWKDSEANRIVFTTPLPTEQLLQKIPLNANIIDVGCGYGRTLEYLHQKGYHCLSGIDVSSSYIEATHRVVPDAYLQVTNMSEFDFGENKYDLVLLMGVIEYVLQDRDQELLFEKISKALTCNGLVLLETFLLDIHSNWKQYLKGLCKTGHWGRFTNSKGYECHHQTFHRLFNLLKKYYVMDIFQRQTILSWSGDACNGGLFILQSKRRIK